MVRVIDIFDELPKDPYQTTFNDCIFERAIKGDLLKTEKEVVALKGYYGKLTLNPARSAAISRPATSITEWPKASQMMYIFDTETGGLYAALLRSRSKISSWIMWNMAPTPGRPRFASSII